MSGLLRRFAELKRKAAARTGRNFPIIVIQEAGLDGFWIHRVLQSERIESHVVDAASILTSRRRRRAKTDRIDGETLVRTLMAYKRGEPRVCSMARAPTPQEEDRRRVCRERRTLMGERVRHVNGINGLLSAHVSGYSWSRPKRTTFPAQLRTLPSPAGGAGSWSAPVFSPPRPTNVSVRLSRKANSPVSTAALHICSARFQALPSRMRFTCRAKRLPGDPDRYVPQFDGFCAMGVAGGGGKPHKDTIDLEAWAVVDGRLYLTRDRKADGDLA